MLRVGKKAEPSTRPFSAAEATDMAAATNRHGAPHDWLLTNITFPLFPLAKVA